MARENVRQPGAVPLFDNMVRVDDAPARHTESSYAFLNRVNRPYWQRVRDQLETYFGQFPESAAVDLAQRFKDSDPQQHYAAWWELYLFALYSHLGYTVTPHPDIDGISKKPDFLLVRDGDAFYLEAAVVFSGIVEDGRSGNREAWIFDLVNKASNPHFHVGLDFERVGMQRPRQRELTVPLESWLNSLNPDDVSAITDNSGAVPELELAIRDWRLKFTALPIRPERRGESRSRLLGVYPASVGWVNDKERLRKTLDKKAGRYGILDKPFIIAIMGTSSFIDNKDIEDALFGNVVYQYSVEPPHNGRWVRNRDGLWMRGPQPRSTRVSAVLIGITTFPWNHTHALPRLWTNPWAKRPLRNTDHLPTATSSEGGAISYAETDIAAHELFDLPEDWPGPDARFTDMSPR